MAKGTSGATLRLFVAASALLAGVSAYRGFLKLFTRLNAYDDTGYMLSLIQSFNQSGGLYRDVFSQYGPFYSEFYFILDRLLGISITHDGIRWVVLSFWVGSSIAAGFVAWQFRRSAWTAILVQMLAFQTLEVLWADPGHPLSLAVACLAGLTVCLSGIGVGKINWWRPIIAGALIGMLLLIKINLGLFALASVGTAAVFCCPVDRAGRLLRWAVGIVFCVLAGAVIGPVWPPFVRVEFITVFACTLIAVLVSTGGALFDWAAASRFCVRASAGLLTICVLAVSGVLLTGTGWADLIAGVIVRPMNLPQLFSVPPSFGPFSAAMAVISVLAAVGLRFLRSRSSTMDRHIGFALRLVLVGAVFAWVTGSCRYWLPFSLLWIAALPPTGESSSVAPDTARFGRGSVVLLAVGQLLGLYPVNGGQQVIPFFLLAVALAPVVGSLAAESAGLRSSKPRRWLRPALVFGIYAVFALALVRLSYRETRNLLAEYRRYPSLALPGANVLRLRADAVATYRFLAENLRGSDPSFVTLPGMNSLYGWSERPLPGGFNATMNFALLTVPEQRRMIQVASSSKPICLVVNRGLLSFWTRGRFEPSGPLLDFMNADCRAIARVNGYELMCLKNTPSPVLTSCATLDEEWGPAGKRGRITATLRDHGFVAATASLLRISMGKSIPVRLVGRPAFLRGTEQDANASATVRQLTAEVDEASAPALRDLDDYLLRLRDEAGEIFAEVPFLRLPDEPR